MGRKSFAVSAAFFIFGMVGGSLVPRLPALKEHLALTDGQVGFALLSYAVGAVVGAIAARLVLRLGARTFVRGATVVLCAALVLPALAPSLVLLALTFLFLGCSSGFLDVLENSQAAEIERDAERPMINGFHGFWSLGAIAGAILAALAAHFGVTPLVHFLVVAVVLALVSVPALAGVPDTSGGAATILPSGTTRWRFGTAVGAVAAIAFLGILMESGGGDWSAIYLRDFGHADPGIAAIGYAGFALAMTLVRFGADRVTARIGPAAVVSIGGVVAAGGIALAIAVPAPAAAILGFTLAGAGSAVIVPLAFSAGANLGATGTALSVVMSAGYAGSIVGPLLIGSTADRVGLRVALAIPALAALAVVIVTVSLKPLSRRAATTAADVVPRL